MKNYSQKNLIDLFKAGTFLGENGVPKHVETVISNVFIFEKNVYKFYKNDNDFFNKDFRNLADKEERFSFTEKDYKWNNTLSPSIYIRLANVIVRDGVIIEVDSREEAEEVLMIMNRVDTHNVLFEKLVSGNITWDDCFEIGKQLGESMKKVQVPLQNPPSFYSLFEERVKDLRGWMKSVPESIPVEEVDKYCDYLDRYRIDNREKFESQLTMEVVPDGDFHSHNAVYSQEGLYLMDTYPPKEEWGLGHKLIPLYRMGIDVWGITGKKDYFEALIEGYESGGNDIKVDRSLDKLYIVYVAGIAVPYLYMLQKTDPTKVEIAKRFHTFLRKYFQRVFEE
jgi:aminoglycoside phosphotransferase family enzyme